MGTYLGILKSFILAKIRRIEIAIVFKKKISYALRNFTCLFSLTAEATEPPADNWQNS